MGGYPRKGAVFPIGDILIDEVVALVKTPWLSITVSMLVMVVIVDFGETVGLVVVNGGVLSTV
jgi:hypothetical protein